MSIKKKGASIAFTATLLASLLATVGAPLVSAAVSQGGASGQTIGRGQTGAAQTYTFTENTAPCFDTPPAPPVGDFTVTFNDVDGGDVTVASASIAAPTSGSLGATVAIGPTPNAFTVDFAGNDPLNLESVTVQYTLAVANTATPGAISAVLTGDEAPCILAATTTATGTLGNDTDGTPATYEAGKTFFRVAVTSVCPFVTTATPGAGTLVFATNGPENLTVTATSGGIGSGTLGAGTQDLTTTASANPHNVGEAVSQTVPNCSGAIASPATVGNVFTVRVGTAAPVTQILPGQNNQPGGSIGVDEAPSAALNSLNGRTITFAIQNPAVFFSTHPATYETAPAETVIPATCTMAADRKSCTITVTDAGTVANEVGIIPTFDVNNDAVIGSPVPILVTVSGGAAPVPAVANNTANPNPGIVAFVGRVIIGSPATPLPNIIIGANNQVTASFTLRESNFGMFQSGLGTNNTFGDCKITGEFFTFAPIATVTNSGGTPGLQLLNPATGLPAAGNSIQGTLYTGAGSPVANNCVRWTVFSASTTGPATILISDGTTNTPNGPHVNVPAGSPPGTTQEAILVGTAAQVGAGCGALTGPAGCAATGAFAGAVANAVRVFNGGIVVTAASQPRIAAGTTGPAGDIVLTENPGSAGLAGRFRTGQVITLTVLKRATPIGQEVLINAVNEASSPIVETNAAESGLLASPAVVVCPAVVPFIGLCTITFTITQQSFGGAGSQPGVARVRNIHYIVLADAQPGPVQVQVTGNGAGGATPFQQVVSNAIIGAEPTRTSIANGSLPGVVKTGTFTASTKIVRRGNYITWQADMDPARAGERVVVEICRYVGTSCTVYTRFSTRAVNSQGIALFHYNNGGNAGRISVRFRFLGNADHGPGVSLARQGLYT